MLDQNTIDRINDAAQIQDVVSDYVTLRKRGANLIGLCPFHNEKTPSFSVSPSKGIFKCFGCGKGGNAVHFIMEHEQINYYEALKYLARKYNIEFEERELTAEEKAVRDDRESMFLVNDFARNYFANILHNHIDGKAVGLAYFRERGFRDDIIRKFQLGYSLDQRDEFTRTAIRDGFQKEYLVKTGLTLENENGMISDRFRGRVMFPVHSLSGKVVAFGGRILKKDDKMAKYVNSPESEIYHKGNELYGIFFAKNAIVKQERCFLVEGYTDVISMHQNGIENVVASSGTALTPGQIRLIHRFTENVTVIYDGDAAGIKASIRGIDLLLEEGLNIRVLLLPNGEDPDSFARKHNSADFIEFVEKNSTDFIRFKTSLLLDEAGNDPVKRAGLITDIVRSISIIPNQVIRAEYVKDCSTLLRVEEAMLYHEINKLKSAEKIKAETSTKPNTDTVAPKTAATPVSSHQTGKYEQEEKRLLQTLIKYGQLDMRSQEEIRDGAEPVTVAEHFFEEINRDGITFSIAIHETIFREYEQLYTDPQFNAEKHFVNHPNGEISHLIADLITEKYTLSKFHAKIKKVDQDTDRLHDLAPRVMLEYKNAIIFDIIKEKLMSLKIASENRDFDTATQIMQELKMLDEVKRQLARELGERIINKI
jgi:DNA primase